MLRLEGVASASVVMAALLYSTMAAYGQNSGAEQEPAQGASPTGQASPLALPDSPSTPDTEAYVLQRGDELEIRVFNIPELTQAVSVRPDGRISLLLLNDVMVYGMTPNALGEMLSERYAEFFRNPRVTVIVSQFTNQQIYVGGEVVAPQMLTLDGRLTAVTAIFRAGGFKRSGQRKEVVLLRDSGQGTPIMTTLDLDAVLSEGSPDVVLQPFDVVFVPKTGITKVGDFVDQYIRQLIPVTMSVGFTYLFGAEQVIVGR